jgi:hypothetical protein
LPTSWRTVIERCQTLNLFQHLLFCTINARLRPFKCYLGRHFIPLVYLDRNARFCSEALDISALLPNEPANQIGVKIDGLC